MLIIGLKDLNTKKARDERTQAILRIFDRDAVLRKKKDLIKKFIEESLPLLPKETDVEKAFNQYWGEKRAEVIDRIAKEEKMPVQNIEKLVGEYLYNQKLPRDQEIADSLEQGKQIDIRVRSSVIGRIRQAIKELVEKFEW